MTLLAEFAITPDVFDVAAYASRDVCGAYLQQLREVMLNAGLVRDLRNRDWRRVFNDEGRQWHERGRQLLGKLATHRRLLAAPPALQRLPGSDEDWCDEAVASHSQDTFRGVIAGDAVAAKKKGAGIVESITRLHTVPWWPRGDASLRLARTRAGYAAALDLVLRYANSVMFIDPHFDPSKARYWDIVDLLKSMGARSPRPPIEIHRAAWIGDGQGRVSRAGEIEQTFRGTLQALADASGLAFEVFLWDDVHDRYLISDLAGICMLNGFDTTRRAGAKTTWNRLSRADRDDVQREYDPNVGKGLRHRFRIEPR